MSNRPPTFPARRRPGTRDGTGHRPASRGCPLRNTFAVLDATEADDEPFAFGSPVQGLTCSASPAPKQRPM
eukprot:8545657-Alexandrium_andersonii.AAC.1